MFGLSARVPYGRNLAHNRPYGRDSPIFWGKWMPETALTVPSNLPHNVSALNETAQIHLTKPPVAWRLHRPASICCG